MLVEHDDAMTLMAAEKYILGELGEDERAQFEEHFFSCEECARDVRDLSAVTQGARELLKNQTKTEPSKQRSAWGWFEGWKWPALVHPGPHLAWASAMLVVIAMGGYQYAALRNEVRPQTVVSQVLQPETRGTEQILRPERLGTYLLLEADLSGASGEVVWDLRKNKSTKVIAHDTGEAPKDGSGELFKVILLRSSLAPGEYTLTVRPAANPAANSWPFRFTIGQDLGGKDLR